MDLPARLRRDLIKQTTCALEKLIYLIAESTISLRPPRLSEDGGYFYASVGKIFGLVKSYYLQYTVTQ